MKSTCTIAILMCHIFLLSGCSIPSQTREEVLVRHSGDRHYDTQRQAAGSEAAKHWDFAVMSENAYHASDVFPVGIGQKSELDRCLNLSDSQKLSIIQRENPREGLSMLADKKGEPLLKAAGWEISPLNATIMQDHELWCKAEREALAFIIYERTQNDVRQIAISFRGTVFSYSPNWRNNFRWFLPILNRNDASSIVQNDLTKALAHALSSQYPNPINSSEKVEIFATGHSLGGAFAQQFSYAFPPQDFKKYTNFRVRKVVVFNPSPANGWYWVEPDLREHNAGGMPISRVFQDGEILAYLRLSLSYVYPPSDGDCVGDICRSPRIEEVRYNRLYEDDKKSNMVAKHSMRNLAAGLATVVGYEPGNYAQEKADAEVVSR